MKKQSKLKLNAISSLINQIVVIVSGLVLPRYILLYYGSTINGLISSIAQFLSVISFLELGVGAVVQSALYKPLAYKEVNIINSILSSARTFFKKIAFFLIIYVFTLIIIFPALVNNEINFWSTAFLILAMSISLFSQYYFGVVNQLLLNADQKTYVTMTVRIVTVLLNTFISVILAISGFSIQFVKFSTGFIYLLRPLYLYYYVNKNYDLSDNSIENYSIPQKWNGVAQHIAAVVLDSSDIIILTMFSTLENVSIYSVYNMVVLGIKQIIMSMTAGVQAFFGYLIAKNDFGKLDEEFSKFEWLIHTVVIFAFGMTAVLINPFIMIYIQGIGDVNYYQPIFSILIILAQTSYCLRLPYNIIVLAAGHYKETQKSAIIEVIINLTISIATVFKYGLVGVAVGTLCAMIYRTVYLTNYLSDNILFRPRKKFIKHIIIDMVTFIIIYFSSSIISYTPTSFTHWIIFSSIIAIIYLCLIIAINNIFYKEVMMKYISRIISVN